MSAEGDKALEERMAKAKAALAAAEAKRAEQDEAHAKVQAVERLERKARDEGAIGKAVDEHGPVGQKIAVVETDLGVVILKRPNHLHFKRFIDKGERKSADFEQLVRPCLVHPDKDAFDLLVEELPAVLVRAADAVVELAGHRNREVSGK